MNKPPKNLPPPLRGRDADTFTEYTVRERYPGTVKQVLAENKLSETAVFYLNSLLEEIPFGKIRPLLDTYAPDFKMWNSAVASLGGKNWLDAPWFLTETYLFRRIIEAVDFFKTGFDPFAYQKTTSLQNTLKQGAQDVAQVMEMIADGLQESHAQALFLRDLWGNQVDLGLWSADEEFDHLHTSQNAQMDHLLVNDFTAVYQKLPNAKRIDFIIDNAGYELFGDFLLASYLLATDPSRTVHFHLKRHPTFVSDATIKDVHFSIDTFKKQPEEMFQQFGNGFAALIENGRFQLHDHLFWTSPFPLWQLPDDLAKELAQSDLLISKGDANYRRALGDLHWPYETPIDQIVTYLDTPVVLLRTCKSEILAGLENGRSEQLRQQEPTWDINGTWGVIQLVE